MCGVPTSVRSYYEQQEENERREKLDMAAGRERGTSSARRRDGATDDGPSATDPDPEGCFVQTLPTEPRVIVNFRTSCAAVWHFSAFVSSYVLLFVVAGEGAEALKVVDSAEAAKMKECALPQLARARRLAARRGPARVNQHYNNSTTYVMSQNT